jgi:hypothetical protein
VARFVLQEKDVGKQLAKQPDRMDAADQEIDSAEEKIKGLVGQIDACDAEEAKRQRELDAARAVLENTLEQLENFPAVPQGADPAAEAQLKARSMLPFINTSVLALKLKSMSAKCKLQDMRCSRLRSHCQALMRASEQRARLLLFRSRKHPLRCSGQSSRTLHPNAAAPGRSFPACTFPRANSVCAFGCAVGVAMCGPARSISSRGLFVHLTRNCASERCTCSRRGNCTTR